MNEVYQLIKLKLDQLQLLNQILLLKVFKRDYMLNFLLIVTLLYRMLVDVMLARL